MSTPSRLQSSQVQSAQDLTVVTTAIARLRAEHDATDDGKTRAILLHEIGVLEERLGQETESARDQLGAVTAEPTFREPLERLIAVWVPLVPRLLIDDWPVSEHPTREIGCPLPQPLAKPHRMVV